MADSIKLLEDRKEEKKEDLRKEDEFKLKTASSPSSVRLKSNRCLLGSSSTRIQIWKRWNIVLAYTMFVVAAKVHVQEDTFMKREKEEGRRKVLAAWVFPSPLSVAPHERNFPNHRLLIEGGGADLTQASMERSVTTDYFRNKHHLEALKTRKASSAFETQSRFTF